MNRKTRKDLNTRNRTKERQEGVMSEQQPPDHPPGRQDQMSVIRQYIRTISGGGLGP